MSGEDTREALVTKLLKMAAHAECRPGGPFTAQHYCPNCDNSIEIDAEALRLAQQALREWVPREDKERALIAAEQAGYEHANGEPVPSDRLAEARRLLKLEDTPDA